MRFVRDLLSLAIDALRRHARRPRFAGAVVLLLASGFAAILGVVSLFRTTVFRPLPWPGVERLVVVVPLENGAPELWSTRIAEQARDEMASEIELAWYRSSTVASTAAGEIRRLVTVGPGFFRTLGTPALAGRLFDASEADASDKAVISAPLARRHFRDADPVGQTIAVGSRGVTVAGVLPEGAEFPTDGDVWVPVLAGGEVGSVEVLGRIRPGKPAESVRQLLTDRLDLMRRGEVPAGVGVSARLTPLSEWARPSLDRRVRVIAIGIAGVFLVIIANVSALILLRTERDRGVVAVRLALGAPLRRLALQAAAEIAVLLAAAAPLAWLGSATFARLLVSQLSAPPLLVRPMTDAVVLAVLVILSAIVGALLTLGPVIRMRSVSLQDAMRGAGAPVDRGAARLRHGVLIAQLATTTMFVALGAMVGVAYLRLTRLDFGFDPRTVAFATVNLESATYRDPAQARRFALEFVERARVATGASSIAAWGTTYPRTLATPIESPVSIEGRTLPAQDPRVVPVLSIDATPSYFVTLGIRRLRGRLFNGSDVEGAEPVMIVDSLAAERLWPGEDPIGKRIRLGGAASTLPWMTVVGVVESSQPVHEFTLEWQSAGTRYPLMYRPFAQGAPGRLMQPIAGPGFSVALTAPGPMAVTLRTLEGTLYELTPVERFAAVGTLSQFIDRTERLRQARDESVVFLVFGIVGLALALIGVITLVDEVLVTRTREIGIRMALGAPRRAIVALVGRQTLRSALAGSVLGALVMAAAGGQLAALIQPEGSAGHTPAPALPAPVLLLIALGAYLLAGIVGLARTARSSGVDPTIAMRAE